MVQYPDEFKLKNPGGQSSQVPFCVKYFPARQLGVGVVATLLAVVVVAGSVVVDPVDAEDAPDELEALQQVDLSDPSFSLPPHFSAPGVYMNPLAQPGATAGSLFIPEQQFASVPVPCRHTDSPAASALLASHPATMACTVGTI